MSNSISLVDEAEYASCPSLFGVDNTPGLVHVEETSSGRIACWYRRGADTERRDEEFHPFFWLKDIDDLEAQAEVCTSTKLAGEACFAWLVEAPSWKVCQEVSKRVSGSPYARRSSTYDSPILLLPDVVQQYLTCTGKTMYGGMRFEDVRRLYICVTSACGAEDLGEHLDSELELVAIADSAGRCRAWERSAVLSEAGVLQALVAEVVRYDPDVIEGYGLYNDVLPYLQARAEACGVALAWGREGEDGLPATMTSRSSKLQIAEKNFAYTRWDLWGRDLVDVWLYARLYDVSSRELEAFDLRSVAEHLGVAGANLPPLPVPVAQSAPQPESVEDGQLDLFAVGAGAPSEKCSFEAYGLAYVALLRGVSQTLAYPYFIQAQFFPYSYQNVVLRGNATKINSLFLREYWRQKQSIPGKPEVQNFAGGLTTADALGLAYDVVHCDVQSLYPSIMLTWSISPVGDSLNIMLTMLARLREFRLMAKAKQREAQSEPHSAEQQGRVRFYAALQGTFKILINSFYGYLGFAMGNFADFGAAAQVTQKGRELLTQMIEWLQNESCRVLEVDTDGIYFVLGREPGDERLEYSLAEHQERARQLIDRLNGVLPQGINVELDGFYQTMFCHKMKNYALLDYDDVMTVRGGGLRSRATEPYLREVTLDMLRLALQGRSNDVPGLFARTVDAIRERRVPVEKLAKTDTLVESLESYSRKLENKSRNRSAAYELALASSKVMRPGDSVTYYITGTKAKVVAFEAARLLSNYNAAKPDENVKYYVGKLGELYKKFAEVLNLPDWKPGK